MNKLSRRDKIIAFVIFIAVTVTVFIVRDDDPFDTLDNSAYAMRAPTINQQAHHFAVREWNDTQDGQNHARPANYYKPYTKRFRYEVKTAYRRWLNRQPNPAKVASKRCCDFDLPTPGEMWNGFVQGAGDGLMCAMYEAKNSLEAAGCAAETAGKGVKWAIADPTEVLVRSTVGCVEDAAIGAAAAASYVAGAIMVRREYQTTIKIDGMWHTVWRNKWVLIENGVGKIPKGLYVCWAATYAKHVLTGP